MADVPSALADRMNGDYEPPILVEPKGGPIPESADEVVAAAADPAAARIQAQWVQVKADLLAEWPATAQPMVDELADQAEAAVAEDDLGALGALVVSAGVIAAVSLLLSGAGTGLAVEAAAGVVAEAASQGVHIGAPTKPGADRIRKTADAVAGIIASGYASGAARAALQVAGASPGEVRGAVEAHLSEVGASANGLVGDNAGALLSAAQHAGRLAVLEQHRADAYEAVEVNDLNRCAPCLAASGHRYDTLAEALVDYPASGNRHCLGRSRCRGFLRAIFT